MPATVIKLGIRDLVEFLSRSGSIVSDFSPTARAIEGTKLHQMIQKRQDDSYQSEVFMQLSYTFDNGTELQLSGRADGVIQQDDLITIDEIKSTARQLDELEPNPVHLAQAKMYAYIYAHDYQQPKMQVRLTYIQIDSQDLRYFYETFTYDDLEDFYLSLMHACERWITLLEAGRLQRDLGLEKMVFPFENYRPGQQKMAASCFHAIKNHQVLFIQAATGIGKTLSTLYPALKALKSGYTSKIMYLTAKTITRQVAIDTLELLASQGVYLRYVVLTAKEKICFLDEARCNPESCPYANGHYDRINEALYDCLEHTQHWTRDVIESYAQKHQVCPFEFSLDLYSLADLSVSDYNYAFDPKVSLKRAFEEKNNYTLLVDEAHNLVDRARTMFSAEITLTQLQNARRSFHPKKGKLYRQLKKIVDYIQTLQSQHQNTPYLSKELPQTLLVMAENFLSLGRKELPAMPEGEMKDALLDVFFAINDIYKISDYYNKDYMTYFEHDTLKLFCLNPAHCLIPIYQNVQSVILFSATLLPIRYFFELLGGLPDSRKLYFASPFPQENKLLLLAQDVQATYRHRGESYATIVAYLNKLLTAKPGHYLIFFPSYQYLQAVLTLAQSSLEDTTIFAQTSAMTEEEREAYLSAFAKEPDQKAVFFCVLGGIFSEGIDLKGNQLIGVIIVSVGLPQICLERELIRQHFDQAEKGYDYAYVYPGFNKVLQGAGRLIRTEEDRGVILLLDTRYQSRNYLAMFPNEWHHAQLTNLSMISSQVDSFYHISVEKEP